ncbi:MAG: Na+/H+ antiporter [Nocardioides sp.]|nr:Na+/H+ antiporter [Nocardioides sp.]
MEIAVLLVGLAVSVLAVTAVSERYGAPAPLVLVVAGALASFVPAVPEVELDAEVVLLGLLPPLLYSASLTTSLVDFNANRRPILLLSVGLVLFTTLGVGVVVHAVVPEVGWAAAFALGAVVAPPDAVAATAIGRRIGLPRRVVTILEGESLLNDATALVSLRTAAAVAAGTATLTAGEVALDFVVAAGGGVLVGVVLYLVVANVRRRLTDPLLDTALSLVVPFAAYVVAEELEASGVIAVVVAGLLLGHRAPVLQTAQSRISERTNWRTIAFVLENAVFLLIGLQTQRIIGDVGDSELGAGTVAALCVSVLVAVVLLRILWVSASRYLLVRPGSRRVPARYSLLVGWAGMRGVVTLAAAFVIPSSVPHREVLLLAAFTVVAGTLLLQGLTLPGLARLLRAPAPDPRDDALARADLLQQASNAGLAELERLADEDPHGVVDQIRYRMEQRNFAAWERLDTTADEETPSAAYSRLRQAMIAAERAKVLKVRSMGRVPAEVVAEVLSMLDVEESMLDHADTERTELRNATSTTRTVVREQCDDLREHPVVETETDGTCPECVQVGARWVALRQCLTCGHVGCCDSSPERHATRHHEETGHPVMQSAQPGEAWRWCFVHHVTA